MRLINTTTLTLSEFHGDALPAYAILSHRWLPSGEVTLSEMEAGTATFKAGYVKIELACRQAVEDKLDYVWVDTCCIDKTSSAELSESINSMYRWYEGAAVCYAYLADVEAPGFINGKVEVEAVARSSFGTSAWWSRGWTLQELIAPSKVVFYGDGWISLGTKRFLTDVISKITRIDRDVLIGRDIEEFTIAQRMSWASRRITTRTEDAAYSLLGLFNVHMPMMYGEGPRAFIRLQEEIMKQSNDHSIFAWRKTRDIYEGLLAESPRDFDDCFNVVSTKERLNRMPYSITNLGLSIELLMVPWVMDTYLVSLDCQQKGRRNIRIGIFVRLLPESKQCARVLVGGIDHHVLTKTLISKGRYTGIYVWHEYHRMNRWINVAPRSKLHGFWIRSIPDKVSWYMSNKKVRSGGYKVKCWNDWNSTKRLMNIPPGSHGTVGLLWWDRKEDRISRSSTVNKSFDICILLGFDRSFNPVCHISGAGGLWGKAWPKYSFGELMEASWTESNLNIDEYHVDKREEVIRGDRLSGLHWPPERGPFSRENPFNVDIEEHIIESEMQWVVDISINFYCDNCEKASLQNTLL